MIDWKLFDVIVFFRFDLICSFDTLFHSLNSSFRLSNGAFYVGLDFCAPEFCELDSFFISFQ